MQSSFRLSLPTGTIDAHYQAQLFSQERWGAELGSLPCLSGKSFTDLAMSLALGSGFERHGLTLSGVSLKRSEH